MHSINTFSAAICAAAVRASGLASLDEKVYPNNPTNPNNPYVRLTQHLKIMK